MGRHRQLPSKEQKQLGERLVAEFVSEIQAKSAEGHKQPLRPAIEAVLDRWRAAPGFDPAHLHIVHWADLLHAEWEQGDKAERARWGIGMKPRKSSSENAAWAAIESALRSKSEVLLQSPPSRLPPPLREVSSADSRSSYEGLERPRGVEGELSRLLSVSTTVEVPHSISATVDASHAISATLERIHADLNSISAAAGIPSCGVEGTEAGSRATATTVSPRDVEGQRAVSPSSTADLVISPFDREDERAGVPSAAIATTPPPAITCESGGPPSTSDTLSPGMHKSIGLTYSASAFICALQLALLSETSPEKTRQALPLIVVVAAVTVTFIQMSKVFKNYAVRLYDRGKASVGFWLCRSLPAFGVAWILGTSLLVEEIMDNPYISQLGLRFGLVSALALIARIIEMEVQVQRSRNPNLALSWIERFVCDHHQKISNTVFTLTVGALALPLWRCEDHVTSVAIVVTLTIAVVLRWIALTGASSRSDGRMASIAAWLLRRWRRSE